jgi:hypothetical protein
MSNEEQIVQLLKEILEEQKKTVKELADIKNLFLKYDMEEFLNDENIRSGLKDG